MTSRKSISKPQADSIKGTRICLGCNTEFTSEGVHNRICRACRGREDVGFRKLRVVEK